MEKYLTLDNLEVGLKFTAILSSGIWSGGAIYVGGSQLPGLLAQSNMEQALINFKYFWPRSTQMPYSTICGAVCGVGAYFVKRRTADLPWLIGGLGFISIEAFTVTVVIPKTVVPLMDPDILEDNDDAHVRGLIKKFGDYHDVRIYVGTAAFIAFTLAYFKST